jgi:hypothetical protein
VAAPEPRPSSNVNAIAVVVALVGGALLLLGWIFGFPW